MADLAWNSVTITSWFHLASESSPDQDIVDIRWPYTNGRDYMIVGNQRDDGQSKAFTFAEEPPYLNRIIGSSESAVRTVVSNIETARLANILGSLTFGNRGTLANYRLRSFSVGKLVVCVLAATGQQYQLPFSATFVNYV